MKFIDLFRLSTRMFKARTSRTLLTVLGMSVGIAAILFLVSLGEGLRITLLEKITTSDSILTLDVTEPKSGIVLLNNDMLNSIKDMPGVEDISPAFQIAAQGHLEGLSADLQVVGAKPSYFKLGGLKTSQGSLINDDDSIGIVISSAVAQVFGKDINEMIGKEIAFSFLVPRINNNLDKDNNAIVANLTSDSQAESDLERIDSPTTYKIVGIIDGEDNVIYINMASLSDLKIDKYTEVKVRAHSDIEMGVIRDDILEYGLSVSSRSEIAADATKIFNWVQFILMLFGLVALIVSAIGMFNTMTITLLERTEEIGIMKSIGASDGGISMMFFMESAIMGFFGGIAGVVVGWLGGQGFNLAINLIANNFGGESVNLFSTPLWLVLAVVGSSSIVGVITGFVPARRASKTDPLDALRYK